VGLSYPEAIMTLTQDQLGKIQARVLAKVGDPTKMQELDLSNKGLALCIIDSIESTGVRYGGVKKVLERDVNYRTTQGGDPSTDGTKELLQTFDGLATPEPWAEAIGNKHKTSTSKGAPLKAVAVRAAAQALADLSILNKDDMRAIALNGERLADVGAAWKAVTAQSSGITWRYVLILAGVPGVKRTA
jgi:hypothetical protein